MSGWKRNGGRDQALIHEKPYVRLREVMLMLGSLTPLESDTRYLLSVFMKLHGCPDQHLRHDALECAFAHPLCHAESLSGSIACAIGHGWIVEIRSGDYALTEDGAAAAWQQ